MQTLTVPRRRRLTVQDAFTMRCDKQAKEKAMAVAHAEGLDLAALTRRLWAGAVAAYEKEHGPIPLPDAPAG